MKATTTINVGSTAKILEVVNSLYVPCDARRPCSPDGKWKAAIGSLSLDAGESQQLRECKSSSPHGPRPFTKVESDGYVRGGPAIRSPLRHGAAAVTFLAKVRRLDCQLSDGDLRRSYPSVFASGGMTFTLPPTGEGPSIEAQVNGIEIVFCRVWAPQTLWATCSIQVAPNGTVHRLVPSDLDTASGPRESEVPDPTGKQSRSHSLPLQYWVPRLSEAK